MKVRAVIEVDLTRAADKYGSLSREAVMTAYSSLGDLRPGSVVVVNIGRVESWDAYFTGHLAELLTNADTVQVTGQSPVAVQRLATALEHSSVTA